MSELGSGLFHRKWKWKIFWTQKKKRRIKKRNALGETRPRLGSWSQKHATFLQKFKAYTHTHTLCAIFKFFTFTLQTKIWGREKETRRQNVTRKRRKTGPRKLVQRFQSDFWFFISEMSKNQWVKEKKNRTRERERERTLTLLLAFLTCIGVCVSQSVSAPPPLLLHPPPRSFLYVPICLALSFSAGRDLRPLVGAEVRLVMALPELLEMLELPRFAEPQTSELDTHLQVLHFLFGRLPPSLCPDGEQNKQEVFVVFLF